ncbi:MRG-domain-containing protein [Radiomyces spectabilis]|uniref:MRG-domain-containing protein n=1 Tax=Radiomyces spectabilis TaxID=64574 RepID=UPI0022200C79|nr:MRG-domain-containing protein [Radiomyces spectabilis]KAI8394081.1 MRG-domain-containing protein [Radiomyces spectabilis]
MAKNEKKFGFDKEERVLCYHGPLLYEAKVIRREKREDNDDSEGGRHYYIHYKGWKQTWDEWVPEERVLKFTDTNIQKQQQLKEMHSKRKPSRSSNTSHPGSSAHDAVESRGRKRHRDASTEKSRMEDDAKRPSFKVPMPESLKGLLVDDWENITKNRQVVRLPCEITVSKILGQYAQSKSADDMKDSEVLNEVIQGIKLYFDKTLNNLLLYRVERKQHDELKSTYPDKEVSDLYGAEHLLRLFVELPSLITKSKVNPETLAVLKDMFADFLSFLQDHEKDYFHNEYRTNPYHQER